MGAAIRSHDWGATPLGPISAWPAALKTIVQMMLHQRHAICVAWGPELIFLFNDAYRPFLGQKLDGALGMPIERVWADVWDDIKPLVDEALAGRGTFSEALRLVMQRNGYDEETFWTFSYSPLRDDSGHIAGLIDVVVDATSVVLARREQDRRDDAEKVLRHELVHRVKNSLAVTSAVVIASMRHASSLQEARDTIVQRIAALGQAQDILANAGDSAEVGEIVRAALASHMDGKGRASLSGPRVDISSQQAVGLSLAIYELATNAVKYGAFSNEFGNVAVRWETSGDDGFTFVWQEEGGPVVVPPQRSGFGSRLTNQIVGSYFSGQGVTTYDPAGLRFELKDRLTAKDTVHRAQV
jgi:two-component sensor histidine kinase